MSGAGARPLPRVFTVPPGQSFIPCFIDGFLSGTVTGSAPLTAPQQAAARIFVPTRRAADALTRAFADAAGGATLLLPRILPLGDDEALEEIAPGILDAEESVVLKPAIAPLDRRLRLFSLVDAWREAISAPRSAAGEREAFYVGKSRSDAFALAGELARLIDEVTIEDVPLARLAGALPASYDPSRHDRYWTLTQQFLAIAATHWPELLDELGVLDAAERQKQQSRLLTRQWSARCSAAPVIIAGSTGSVAATADLMAAVARLPLGAVVLPGLDLTLDEESWSFIADERADLATRYAHPQTQLKRTLERIGITRADVLRLPAAGAVDAREVLASELFRPAETTARWQQAPSLAPGAFDGFTLIAAEDEQEEALAIALALREVLETPERTAALVTADPALSRRVQVELARWGVMVNDSAGLPLADAPLAVLARLALEAMREEAGAADLLALLRHPLALIGAAEEERAGLLATIEIAGLRGKPAGADPDRLIGLLEQALHAPPSHRDPVPQRRLTAEQLTAALAHVRRVAAVFAPFRALLAGTPTLRQAAAAHQALVQGLLTGAEAAPGWPETVAGRLLGGLYDALALGAEEGPAVGLDDYAGIFGQMAGEIILRQPGEGHPRIGIWGLLEARLLSADRIVLGGLNEGVWPPDARSDPFLNRPMRIALGLQPPERRIGQTAHDFLMLIGGGDVVLTRAGKTEGQPMIASRFLRRFEALAGEKAWDAMAERGACYLDWARALDAPARVTPAARPEPRIPPALMPPRLALTEIETLYRDPYVLFARHVLGLDPLEPLDQEIDARDRGTVIHQALADYARQAGEAASGEGAALLTAIGTEAFAAIRAEAPEIAAFWWQRFIAFVPWFVGWDGRRRAAGAQILVEQPGRETLALAGGHPLVLSTRADRIEQMPDGTLAIIDFKTGTAPSGTQVLSGKAPQLPLTAALAARGAFAGLGHAAPDRLALAYVEVGKARGAGAEKWITSKDRPLEEIVEEQFARLTLHLEEYLAGARGFTARRMPERKTYASDYDGLARVLEWTLGGETEDEE